MCKIYCLSRLKMKGCWNDGATSFRPRPHETRHFWNRIFFYPDSCGRARLTALESGFKTMRFRWADSLVSCERKVDSCFKVCGSENIRIRVNEVFKIQLFTLFLVLNTLKLSWDRHFCLRTTNNYFEFSWPHKAIKCLMVLCFLITDQPTEKTRANLRRGRHSDSTYFVTSKYYSLLKEC